METDRTAAVPVVGEGSGVCGSCYAQLRSSTSKKKKKHKNKPAASAYHQACSHCSKALCAACERQCTKCGACVCVRCSHQNFDLELPRDFCPRCDTPVVSSMQRARAISQPVVWLGLRITQYGVDGWCCVVVMRLQCHPTLALWRDSTRDSACHLFAYAVPTPAALEAGTSLEADYCPRTRPTKYYTRTRFTCSNH